MLKFATDHYSRGIGSISHLLVLLGILLFNSCIPWQIGAERNVVKNGIHFAKFKQQKDGKSLGYLAEDTTIDGYPCSKGFIVWHSNWKLKEFNLYRPIEFAGVSVPANTWMFPNRNGDVLNCVFPMDIEIQGRLVRGGAGGLEGVVAGFYPGEKLRSYSSREDVVIDNIPCKGSVIHRIYLHENGLLMSCWLAEPSTIDGLDFPARTRVSFDSNGKPAERK
jgi:hypothetical protein